MASLAHQIGGLKNPSLHTSRLSRKVKVMTHNNACKYSSRTLVVAAAAVAITSNAQTRERLKLKEMFLNAYQRCHSHPMDGVPFTLDDFLAAIELYDFSSEIGTKVTGTVFSTDANGALVDITAKSSAYLPVHEACIYDIKHVEEAGIVQGLSEEFVIIGKNEADDSLILSLRSNQYDIAWERCRQLQAEDIAVKGKVIDANKGGIVALVEGLRGFVPFSQISMKSVGKELIDKEILLKFVEVDEEQSKLVLSNSKALVDSQSHLEIGSVVTGSVQSLKPYGAFIDIGGISGLLHVSQISQDLVSDLATVFQPGDVLKVMILSNDRERGRISLSTKKLEPSPGDMIRNPKLVFEKAEEMGQIFRERIAQAEAMARADMLRLQPESRLLCPDPLLSPLALEAPPKGLDFE
ncbi:hypothetical protein DCAR_0102634 [Daucus carota subsp. sativus]|uniref:S1 motif domain-containing protein n=1 Tax=Daucus carota subsp. sativus TaxID=79200 RepID=A0AAF1AH24_DAUCS|nr:hypothetical protein DCAR_0102634 [Daucus carota subsp. sativus]